MIFRKFSMEMVLLTVLFAFRVLLQKVKADILVRPGSTVVRESVVDSRELTESEGGIRYFVWGNGLSRDIRYRDACDDYPGTRLLTNDESETLVIVDDNTIVCCNRKRKDYGSENIDTGLLDHANLNYEGSTTLYSLSDAEGDNVYLFDMENDGSYCDNLCGIAGDNVILGDTSSCEVGNGWIRIPDYGLAECETTSEASNGRIIVIAVAVVLLAGMCTPKKEMPPFKTQAEAQEPTRGRFGGL